jgi:hypothetical protein
MPTAFARFLLFLSSFSPLFLVFGLLDSFHSSAARITCYAIAGVSAICLGVFLWAASRISLQSIEAATARPRDSDTIGYVVTYLIPFLTLGTSDWASRAALILFIAVVAVLYVRSNIFYVNPLLSLVGYRLFEVEAGVSTLILITKRSFVAPGVEIRARRLSDYVYWEA